ncbi:MAG: S1C family serine protease [bacterium]
MSQLLPRLSLLNLVFFIILYYPLNSFAIDQKETETTNLYANVEESIYQIRVLNKRTGKKAVIGSGFIVNRPDILATNYHVISSYVNDPETYELDYLSTTNENGSLTLLDLDVIHDLAVVKADKPLGKPLSIADLPKKGANLYSLGNPMDLGFSIVPGTNNGILESSEDQSILFSGSLNPGMSGGPTLNGQGEVIGINVATSGNEISFLVPANFLAIILERLALRNYQPDSNFFKLISRQLLQTNQNYIADLLSNTWKKTYIGKFEVPSDLSTAVRCWDSSRTPRKEDLFQSFYTRCSNDRSIYLDEGLELGTLDFEYQWLESEELHPARLYRRYENLNSSIFASNAGKDDVTNISCHTDFILVAKQSFKATICRRDYYRYDGLSDLLITMAMVGHGDKGFIFNLDLLGTDFDAALTLFKRMVSTFQWND